MVVEEDDDGRGGRKRATEVKDRKRGIPQGASLITRTQKVTLATWHALGFAGPLSGAAPDQRGYNAG